MRIAVDTNRYTDLCRGDPSAVTMIERADAVFLPFIVVAELRAGFAVGTRGPQNEGVLRQFLSKPGVSVLYAADATTHIYANLYRQLRAQGTPIPTNDLWIASLATEHTLSLMTRDDHFRHLPQLSIV